MAKIDNVLIGGSRGPIFTVRNCSCGKLMFSHVSVSPRGVYNLRADNPLGRHPLPLGRHPPPPGQTPPGRQTPQCADTPSSRRLLQRTVRILLECFFFSISQFSGKNVQNNRPWHPLHGLGGAPSFTFWEILDPPLVLLPPK